MAIHPYTYTYSSKLPGVLLMSGVLGTTLPKSLVGGMT